jgi:thiol-disulfide isomerase/thioredoxin
MKILTIILFSTAFIFCSRAQNNDIVISLKPVNGYGEFTPGRMIIFPENDSIQYRGVPNNIREFVVRSMSLQNVLSYWNLYKKGKIDKERFLKISTELNIDTSKLTEAPVDYQVIILTGTNQKGNRIIIVDSDNNEDFSNDKILEFEYPISIEKQKAIENSLQSILTHYEYYFEDKIIKKQISLKPSPYRGSLGLNYNTTNEIERKYDLFVSVPEYRKGEINLNNTNYEVFVSNGFTSQSFTNRKTSIFFSIKNGKQVSELKGDIPYLIGDIMNANGMDYLIESISIWGDTLRLKYVGQNVYPAGITEGYFIPKFNAKKLDNSVFSLEQYPGKFVLIDFWGTWCKPCIEFIPELKEINAEFKDKNFVLVSVAYDNDSKKVVDFVKKEQMDWVQVYVDQKTPDNNSLVEKLKISIYPTTILIAPDGKIITRNKPINELKEILKKAL